MSKLMKMSQLFGRTLRESPADAELDSHKLMVRAGLIRKLKSGSYSYLPLMYRTLRKIEEVIRQEMDAIDGQEINMPVVHPAELWQESGRYHADIPEMVRFKDRNERNLVLGMTHEEIVTDLVRNEIESYKRLPFMLYQIQTKYRDEARPRGGLIRVREFVMKDGYSFHTSFEDLDRYYEEVAQAYNRIYERCGLDAVMVEGDSGMMGGTGAHEFESVTEVGEDSLVLCRHCNYAANTEVAKQVKCSVNENEDLLAVEEVATPKIKQICQVSNFLGVAESETIKTLIYHSKGKVVLVAIRGDMEVNEVKLQKVLLDGDLRLATDEEARAAGLTPGYVSPVDIKELKVVVDDSLVNSRNLVAGANKEGYHLKNVNFKRDFDSEVAVDIAQVKDGDTCMVCGKKLELVRGIEVGNIFKLGTKYSKSMGATYLDENGKEQLMVMGCYGIGVGRLAASIVEQSHDNDGIIWPINVAPYHVSIVPIGKAGDEVFARAEEMAKNLTRQGIEVLFDDRDLRPGVKFKDADLIGIPVRIVLSKRSLNDSAAEVKLRHESEKHMINIDDVENWVVEYVEENTDL